MPLATHGDLAVEPSMTIDEFCLTEKISRSTFYNLERVGKAPKTIHIGRHRRILPEQHKAGRERMAAE